MNNKAKEAYEKYIKDKISPDISSITDIKDLEDFIIEFNKVPDIFKKIIIQKQKIFLDDCMALRDVAIKYAVYFTYSQYMQFISDFRGTAQEIYDNAIKNGINIEDYGIGNTVEDIQKKIDFDKDMRLAIIDYVLNYFDSIGKKKEFVNELEGFICRSEECFNKFNRVDTTIQLFKKEIKMS